jgi:uracil phosphoribosyltransferase
MDITARQLCDIHEKLGEFIAHQLIAEFGLVEIEIHHPQGLRTGLALAREKSILLLAFQRAGVFFASGIRYMFPNSPFFCVTPVREVGITPEDWKRNEIPPIEGKSLIIVDSVINTAKTMIPTIEQVKQLNPKKIIVASIVMPASTRDLLEQRYPEVCFYTARVSTNSYVGKGSTDTGNRLYGTHEYEE